MIPFFAASAFREMRFCRFNDFGEDGGPAAKELAPKVAGLQDFLVSKLGTGIPKIDVNGYFFYSSYFT